MLPRRQKAVYSLALLAKVETRSSGCVLDSGEDESVDQDGCSLAWDSARAASRAMIRLCRSTVEVSTSSLPLTLAKVSVGQIWETPRPMQDEQGALLSH